MSLPLRLQKAVPWIVVLLFVGATALSMWMATPNPTDDHFFYQKFIETLAGGKLDLSIPGFHGMNILTVPWYLITRSPLAQIEFQMLAGILLPLFAFLAARSLYKSDAEGLLFAAVIAMMPFLSFSALRGWMVALYNALFFITIWASAKQWKWWWIPWGFSVISLPFSVALLPLLAVLAPPSKKGMLHRYRFILLGLAIPVVYVVMQFLQIGHINVGVHTEMDHSNVWQGPSRMFLNAAHALQILFSVHNYYFPNPGRTGDGNMLQTTPVLIFLGLFALLSPKEFFKKRALPLALLLGAIIGIGLNVALDHMDHFYMETGIFFVILAALPVLRKYPLWLPLVLATLHFQWFYFSLQHGAFFQLDWWFFAVPAVVDAVFVLWCLANWKAVWGRLTGVFPLSSLTDNGA
ncbi:MAG: hypothetical protein Q7R81_01620 [Candidatus Peregrinibacteria bacterium]|nr:hypothetical protein [Candidatus Peregrinibacteria bacterium]